MPVGPGTGTYPGPTAGGASGSGPHWQGPAAPLVGGRGSVGGPVGALGSATHGAAALLPSRSTPAAAAATASGQHDPAVPAGTHANPGSVCPAPSEPSRTPGPLGPPQAARFATGVPTGAGAASAAVTGGLPVVVPPPATLRALDCLTPPGPKRARLDASESTRMTVVPLPVDGLTSLGVANGAGANSVAQATTTGSEQASCLTSESALRGSQPEVEPGAGQSDACYVACVCCVCAIGA